MQIFDKTVPFDPGFYKITFSFIENVTSAIQEYNSLKANHQKKFWLVKFEPLLLELVNKSTAFYLGCMLWGGFIHYRFKDEPKEISDNSTACLSEKEIEDIDCAVEVKYILQYIEIFDRDCKYFLKRPAKISPKIKEILENYIEFALLNNNFIGINSTDKIKLPQKFEYFKDLTNGQLDDLCEEIYSVIDENKIENLL